MEPPGPGSMEARRSARAQSLLRGGRATARSDSLDPLTRAMGRRCGKPYAPLDDESRELAVFERGLFHRSTQWILDKPFGSAHYPNRTPRADLRRPPRSSASFGGHDEDDLEAVRDDHRCGVPACDRRQRTARVRAEFKAKLGAGAGHLREGRGANFPGALPDVSPVRLHRADVADDLSGR